MAQPIGIESHDTRRPLILVKRTGSSRRAERQARHRHHCGQRPRFPFHRGLARRPTQQVFGNAKIAGQHPPVLLIQLAGRAALDELLNIGRVTLQQAGKVGIILPPLGNQPFQHHARIFSITDHDSSIMIGIFLDK